MGGFRSGFATWGGRVGVIVGSAFWKKCLKGGEENGVEFGYVCSKLFVHDVIFSDESGLKTINP